MALFEAREEITPSGVGHRSFCHVLMLPTRHPVGMLALVQRVPNTDLLCARGARHHESGRVGWPSRFMPNDCSRSAPAYFLASVHIKNL